MGAAGHFARARNQGTDGRRKMLQDSVKRHLSGLDNTQSTLHDPSQNMEVPPAGRNSQMNKPDYSNYGKPGLVAQMQLETHSSLPNDQRHSAISRGAQAAEGQVPHTGAPVSRTGQSHPNSKSQGSQRFAIYSAYQT